MAVSVSTVHFHDSLAGQESGLEKTVGHNTGLGEDPDSKFWVWFLLNAYVFCTIIK